MTLLEPHNVPFAAALVLMLLLAIMQALGLGDAFGEGDLDIDGDIEADLGGKSAGLAGGAASLLGLGRIPLMAWLAVYLFVFAGGGLAMQSLADSLLGDPFERWLAALMTAGIALPITGVIVRPLGAILPKDRTSAVTLDELLGREAIITDGTARSGSPARAKALDQHGQSHLVMIEPEDSDQSFAAGDQIVLLRKEGSKFYAALAAGRTTPAQ